MRSFDIKKTKEVYKGIDEGYVGGGNLELHSGESTSETAERVNSGAEGKEAERGISNSHSGWVVTHVTCENP